MRNLDHCKCRLAAVLKCSSELYLSLPLSSRSVEKYPSDRKDKASWKSLICCLYGKALWQCIWPADQNQGWQWWLLLALYAGKNIDNGVSVWLHIWAWEQGIVNLSQEQSNIGRQTLSWSGCASTVMRLIQTSMTSDLDFKDLKASYNWQVLKFPI